MNIAVNYPLPTSGHEIAIIGMSGRFPACDNVDQFWNRLVNGQSGVRPIQPNPTSQLPQDPNFVPMAATVDQADCFDAGFFGILPRMAQEIDPQHRLFLEACWLALEDAGYRPDATPGRVGLYAGCHMNTYIFLRLAADQQLRRNLADSFPGGNLNAEILNDKDYLATRVAYQLNLRGPAVAVQSACSTSLVAIAEACKSLETGQCEMALAGGVTVTFPQDQGYLHTEDSILSPDGYCRTFDADAKGTIFGDGVGVVVLKRLADALRDGDSVYAVIKGWGVNNDGADKGSYTAPSISGQRDAILAALEKANVNADTISYVEAHGTGTQVGDPIEITALTEAYRRTTDQNQFCAIGSLKSNFGHLDVAAGVTAAIKVAISLNRKMLPPTLHFRTPNPRINFEQSPFFVQTQLMAWPESRNPAVLPKEWAPRRAGLSSFGVGGTNAHLIMEEFIDPKQVFTPIPQSSPLTIGIEKGSRPIKQAIPTSGSESEPVELANSSTPNQPLLFCLSAKNADSLKLMRADLIEHLVKHPEQRLADVSFTLAMGRKPMPHRFACAVNDRQELIEALGERNKQEPEPPANTPQLTFLFPGQGSQHIGMARSLYQADRQFTELVDQAAAALTPHVGFDLRGLVFGTDGIISSGSQNLASHSHPDHHLQFRSHSMNPTVSESKTNPLDPAVVALQSIPLIDQTAYAQPAIFMISYALGKWMIERGFRPDILAGHSVGEFAAATIAGVMSLEIGAELIATRGRLMQQLPLGSMLAVNIDRENLSCILPVGLEIAAYNAELLNVVAGPTSLVKAFEVKIENGEFGDEISCRLLNTSHAFHSTMMDAAIAPFVEVIQRVKLNPPQIKMISTVTGRQLSSEEAVSVDYWANQIRRPVEFSQAIAQMLMENPKMILCEVGPNQALTTLVRQFSLKPGKQTVIPLLPHVKQETCNRQYLWERLAEIWRGGFDINWTYFFHASNHNRVRDGRSQDPMEPELVAESVLSKQGCAIGKMGNDNWTNEKEGADYRRVHLPTYRFDRKRYWFEVASPSDDLLSDAPVIDTINIVLNDASVGSEANLDGETGFAKDCRAPTAGLVDSFEVNRSNSTPTEASFNLIQQQMQMMQQQVEILKIEILKNSRQAP